MATIYEQQEHPLIGKFRSALGSILPSFGQPPSEPMPQPEPQPVPEDSATFGPMTPVPPYRALNRVVGHLTSPPGLEFLSPLQIRAFHGSPYKFSKFSNEKIGTGEGAQAFGWGHYVSEDPAVANSYLKARGTIHGMEPDKFMSQSPITGNVHAALRILREKNPAANIEDAAKFMESPEYKLIDTKNKIAGIMKSWNDRESAKDAIARYYPNEKDELIGFMNLMEKSGDLKWGDPHFYETTINKGKPESADVFLEWDKPIKPSSDIWNKVKAEISKLPDDIRKNVNDTFRNYRGSIRELYGINEMRGEDIYKSLARSLGSEKEASLFLSRAGITGNRYPTGSLSGMKDTGKNNLVVFNPEDITIEGVK